MSDTIATSKKQITYSLNHDGSVVLRSFRGITDKQLKRMSDDELRAIGLFKTLIGKDEKFFPTDETLELRYQEKSKPIVATDVLLLSKAHALAIAQKIDFSVTGQKIRDWARGAFESKNDETKQSNRQKLADVGLVPVKTDKSLAWTKL